MAELKSSNDSKDLGQKKTTWASIASQPAKPQMNIQSQSLKKKGPGMPPGPIVPGKHNIDIGTWETNKVALLFFLFSCLYDGNTECFVAIMF